MRMFENRVLRRIFGAERDEVTVEWRELHNEELNDLYSSPKIILVRMRWTGHVARTGRGAYRVLMGIPDGRNHLKDLGVDGMIILKLVFKKWDGE